MIFTQYTSKDFNGFTENQETKYDVVETVNTQKNISRHAKGGASSPSAPFLPLNTSLVGPYEDKPTECDRGIYQKCQHKIQLISKNHRWRQQLHKNIRCQIRPQNIPDIA